MITTIVIAVIVGIFVYFKRELVGQWFTSAWEWIKGVTDKGG